MVKYFAVVYCKDGTIHLWPGESKEDCLKALKKLASEDSRVKDRMLATTIIKRDMSNFKDGFIFGNPKSLNVVK